MDYKVISFYKYINIAQPAELRDKIREFCEKDSLLGRVLIGKEGLNGAVSGKKHEIERFKEWLTSDKRFFDLSFREQEYEKNAYHKLVVKVRKEIVNFGAEVDVEKSGRYVTPEQLKEMYDKSKEFIIIDARNDYEYKVGKFENAVELPIRNFRDFPKKKKELGQFKNKKIVMYCTGGIRCEKASAYLNEQGFRDVNHLKGGIIAFNNKYPETYFKGANFVFDDRLVDTQDLLTDCEICGNSATNYLNCHNLDCDRLYACCDSCKKKLNKCCSEECVEAPRHRKKKINYKTIGRVENYYSKPKVALVELEKPLKRESKVIIKGKTTKKFEQEVKEIRDYDKNEINSGETGKLVTIPVERKVRKNDKVLVT